MYYRYRDKCVVSHIGINGRQTDSVCEIFSFEKLNQFSFVFVLKFILHLLPAYTRNNCVDPFYFVGI